MAIIALDIAVSIISNGISLPSHYYLAQVPVFGICDFMAQSILIHRCWIVWNYNARVVIIPSILAFAFLVIWIASIGGFFIEQGEIYENSRSNILLTLTGLTASTTVNALVTGLIVFKIFEVFREVKSITTADEKSAGATRRENFRSVIFIIVESGMVLFAIQLVRVSITAHKFWTDTEYDVNATVLIVTIHQMLNGITPTIIQLRVSMELSFHNRASLVGTVSSLEFAANNLNAISGAESYIREDEGLYIVPDDPNAIPEMVNISQERRDDGIGGNDKIQMADG